MLEILRCFPSRPILSDGLPLRPRRALHIRPGRLCFLPNDLQRRDGPVLFQYVPMFHNIYPYWLNWWHVWRECLLWTNLDCIRCIFFHFPFLFFHRRCFTSQTYIWLASVHDVIFFWENLLWNLVISWSNFIWYCLYTRKTVVGQLWDIPCSPYLEELRYIP